MAARVNVQTMRLTACIVEVKECVAGREKHLGREQTMPTGAWKAQIKNNFSQAQEFVTSGWEFLTATLVLLNMVRKIAIISNPIVGPLRNVNI